MFRRAFLAAYLLLIAHQQLVAQIWVEFLSRSDTFGILGSGSDNKVRIHNLPAGVSVEMENAAIEKISENDYVICRVYSYDYNDQTARLIVKKDNNAIFSKSYRIYPTANSGTRYNPNLYLLTQNTPIPTQTGPNTFYVQPTIMTIENFHDLARRGLSVSDTAFHLRGFTLGCDCGGHDYYGPFHIGAPYSVSAPKSAEYKVLPLHEKFERNKRMVDSAFAKYAEGIHRNGRVFIDDISVYDNAGKVSPVDAVVISVQ